MGEYAEQYTLETFGVDISVPDKKSKWKWACPKCGKNLAGQTAQKQHLKDKHKITEPNIVCTPELNLKVHQKNM